MTATHTTKARNAKTATRRSNGVRSESEKASGVRDDCRRRKGLGVRRHKSRLSIRFPFFFFSFGSQGCGGEMWEDVEVVVVVSTGIRVLTLRGDEEKVKEWKDCVTNLLGRQWQCCCSGGGCCCCLCVNTVSAVNTLL